MYRRTHPLKFLLFALLMLLGAGYASTQSSFAQGASPTPIPTELPYSVLPVNPAPTPVVSPIPLDERPEDLPTFTLPPTLDELLRIYPELGAYIDELTGTALEDIDFEVLYEQMYQIYEEQGIAGLSTFLRESGLLERMGVPLSYLDLLIELGDVGSREELKAEAQLRGLMNDKDEFVLYVGIDNPQNLAEMTAALEQLEVTVYDYLANSQEVQIGIPFAELELYDRPDDLLSYLINIVHVPHVDGVRLPIPVFTSEALESVGGGIVGADAWNSAGFTGKGVRVGVLDMEFGGISGAIANSDLPSDTQMNVDEAVLDRQRGGHGTAAASVVHGVAPDAEIYIAYFDPTDKASWLEALLWLADNDIQIVSFSAGTTSGPRNGSAWAHAEIIDFISYYGWLWINAAGNEATSHYLSPYQAGQDGFHQFGRREDQICLPFTTPEVPYRIVITLNWNGNWRGRETNNYSITLVDLDSDEIVEVAAEERNGRSREYPNQKLVFESDPDKHYCVAIQSINGTGDHILDLFVGNGDLPEWAQVPRSSISDPADSPLVLAVGATGIRNDSLEYYSSQGPTMGRSPITKPDITAPTGEIVPGYPEGFYGTSGATPLIVGAAALVMQRFPDWTAPEVKAYLQENVRDLGDLGIDNEYGAGRLALPEDNIQPVALPASSAPSATLPPSEPSATVTDFNVQFGTRMRGETGMSITMSFEVDNMRGRQIAAILLIGDSQGDPVPSPVDEYDINGRIGTIGIYDIRQDHSTFADVALFLPDAVFSQVPAGTQLQYVVGLVDASSDDFDLLWASEPDYLVIG